MSKPSFVYVTYIATTPEKVWRALTDTEVTRRYWGPLNPDPNHTAPFVNVSDWKPGSRWQHRQLDEGKTVGVVGKVLESTPSRRLVLTWARPADADNSEKTSRVTFDIEPQGDGLVKLTVLHEDLDPEMHRGVSGGWPQILSSLKTLLETGNPLGRSRGASVSATTNSHAVRIEVTKSPRDAFDCITAITKWWVAPAGDFEGRSTALGDEFVIRHDDVHYSRQRLVEEAKRKK